MSVPPLPADRREILVAINPNAGSRNRQEVVQDLVDRLTALDFRCTSCADIRALGDLAQQKMAEGTLRAVLAAGGDGTVSLLANITPPETPLLIVPLGTENLLAKYLGMTADPARLAAIVAQGELTTFDAGRANGRLFTLMAGCGFDAEVVRRLHQRRKGNIHHLSYALPILDSIRDYAYPPLTVYYDQTDPATGHTTTAELTGRWVFVVNVPRYAGGLSFAPSASATDGLLDVCVFEEGSLWMGLWYLGGVMLGQHETFTGFHHVQTTSVRVEAKGAVPYQLDGDPGGELPVQIDVLPQRLTLLTAAKGTIEN